MQRVNDTDEPADVGSKGWIGRRRLERGLEIDSARCGKAAIAGSTMRAKYYQERAKLWYSQETKILQHTYGNSGGFELGRTRQDKAARKVPDVT